MTAHDTFNPAEITRPAGDPREEGPLRCLSCEAVDGVKMESSRTMYHWEGPIDSPDNPNRDIPLCRTCALDHHHHWDEVWAEYYAGLL